MGWQRESADLTGEVLPNGRFAYETVILKVPRQAGKSLLTLTTLVQRCSMFSLARCWYTAQDRQHASGMLMISWAPIVEASRLKDYVKVRRSIGSENLHLTGNGSQVGVFTPDATALHSQQGDTVVCDEAWAHSLEDGEELEEAIYPTMITRPYRQLWIVSAAGDDRSTWFSKWLVAGREAVLEGRNDKICLIEYSAADTLDEIDDVYDRDLWRRTHPAIGETIPVEALESDAEKWSKAKFARAYLGVEGTPRSGEDLVDMALWDALLAPRSRTKAPLAVAGAISMDRRSASVAIAGRRSDGKWHVEVIAARKGIDWVAGYLRDRRSKWGIPIVVDDKGPSITLVDDLRLLFGAEMAKPGGPVVHPGTAGVTSAAAGLLDDIGTGALAHRDQPVLDAALRVAAKRPVGDAWAISRKGSSGDVSPMEAVSLALWGAKTLKPATDFAEVM